MVFKSYKKNTKGNVSMTFALCLLALLAGSGAALDYSHMTRTSTQLQGLTDAMALAAAVSFKNETHNASDLDEFASVYLAQSEFSDAKPVWDVNENGLSLTLRTNERMTFMSLFGDNEKPISTIARVPVSRRKNITVALVLDTTLSMRGSKLDSLKSAANELIEIITEDGANDTYMSVVPFTETVKLPLSYETAIWFNKPGERPATFKEIDFDLSENCRIETTGETQRNVCDVTVLKNVTADIPWSGCTNSRDFGFHKIPEYKTERIHGYTTIKNYCRNRQNAMAPMTKDVTLIKDTVNAMVAKVNTYIPSGLIWGWRTLQEAEPLTGVQDAPAGSQKIMVLMTDGANEVSLGGTDAYSDGIYHNGNDTDAADALTAELCEDIKNDDILVFTIALEVSDSDTISLIKNCATSPAHFYDLSDETALSNAFNNIGVEVDDIRLSL